MSVKSQNYDKLLAKKLLQMSPTPKESKKKVEGKGIKIS